LFAWGCKKNHIDSTQNTTAIFPNTVGNSWVYKVNDSAFTTQNFTAASQYNITIAVTGSIQLPGGINANVWVYNYPGFTDTNYVFQKGDTISFAANTLPNINIVRQYIIPLQLHHSWKYTSNSIHQVTVDSQYHIIVGPYNFDNAFHIQGYPGRPDEMFDVEEWLVDNVGVVKRYFNNVHFTNNSYEHIISWSLVSYHIQ
jgi:hypothetical protein